MVWVRPETHITGNISPSQAAGNRRALCEFKRQMTNHILTLHLLFVGECVIPNEASANLTFNVNVLITLGSG